MSLELCFSFPSTWKGRLRSPKKHLFPLCSTKMGNRKRLQWGGEGRAAQGVPCGASGGEIPLIMRARGGAEEARWHSGPTELASVGKWAAV